MSSNDITEGIGKIVTPPEEKQAQIITSPDDKLQTLHHHMFHTRFGHRIVEGVVKNISSAVDLNAEIRVDYYDDAGRLMGTEVETVRCLQPGKTGAFEAVHSGPKRSYIKYYKLKVSIKS